VNAFTIDCTVMHCSAGTVGCECFRFEFAMFDGGMVKLYPEGPKRLAEGTPPGAADTWRLGRPRASAHSSGCNHLVLGLAKALASRHLARGLPSLGC
jgi:hypothetical protein